MNFPPEVERWRPVVAKYFPPHLVDKALWVIMYESGGNPGAVGDGGNAIGLFQIHHGGSIRGRPSAQQLADPEFNIRYAAQALGAASGNWRPWGENNLYEGKPFGALGHHPFPGDSLPAPAQAATAKATGAVGSLFSTLFGAGLKEQQSRPIVGNTGYRGGFGKSIRLDAPSLPGENAGGRTSFRLSGDAGRDAKSPPPPVPGQEESKDSKGKKGKRSARQIEEERRKLLAAIADIDAMLAEAGDNLGYRRGLERERKYYQDRLARLEKEAREAGISLSAAGGQDAAKPTQPPTFLAPGYRLYNPKSADEYYLLLWQIEQAISPYLERMRQTAPWLTLNGLLSTETGLPPGMAYVTEPPVPEGGTKPITRGWEGPGVYIISADRKSVKRIMDDKETQQYYRALRDYAQVVGTFGPYFETGKELDPAQAWANSAEVLAWQDAADRASYEQALLQAADQLAARELMHWQDTWKTGGEQRKNRDLMLFEAGIGRMMPVMMNSFIGPSREERLSYWTSRLKELAPPAPPRPVPPPGIFGSAASPPRVPGWDDYDPVGRLGINNGYLPAVPM